MVVSGSADRPSSRLVLSTGLIVVGSVLWDSIKDLTMASASSTSSPST